MVTIPWSTREGVQHSTDSGAEMKMVQICTNPRGRGGHLESQRIAGEVKPHGRKNGSCCGTTDRITSWISKKKVSTILVRPIWLNSKPKS